jgi:AraC-like DNA-binding protein
LTCEHETHDRVIDETVLIACVEGEGWLELKAKRYSIRAGDLFYCPIGTPHGYGCTPKGWEIYWVHTQGERVEEALSAAEFSHDSPVHPIGSAPPLLSAFDQLIREMSRPGGSAAWGAAKALHDLLLTVVQLQTTPPHPHRLADLADENCRSLDELVAASGYSRYHFCRLFKEETGESPWQYVLGRKLERGRELLIGTRLSVKQIAATLGFRNPDYFARLFARRHGVTPTAYRGRT